MANPPAARWRKRVTEGVGSISVLPYDHQDQLAGRKDSVVDIPLDQTCLSCGQTELRCYVLGRAILSGVLVEGAAKQRYGRAHTGLCFVQTVVNDFLSLGYLGIHEYLTDAKMVVSQDAASALFLNRVVHCLGAPPDDGLLVTSAREREDPTFTRQTPIADVGRESVDFLQLWSEHLCVAEITIPLITARVDFKQD